MASMNVGSSARYASRPVHRYCPAAKPSLVAPSSAAVARSLRATPWMARMTDDWRGLGRGWRERSATAVATAEFVAGSTIATEPGEEASDVWFFNMSASSDGGSARHFSAYSGVDDAWYCCGQMELWCWSIEAVRAGCRGTVTEVVGEEGEEGEEGGEVEEEGEGEELKEEEGEGSK